ncbi:MAG: Na/Pi cotransporter family protein [Lachnospiraceae bacterium]|nr:Na/Pi cotransporter family protein [Lachnospiraceae bacterium]
MENLKMLFNFLGGVGMFLYGLHIMAEGLQKTAGSRMKKLMGYLTNNRLLAVLVGTAITAVMQSSSATTVMVVGFVNAEILSLTQAVGVIMGANIGTTVTAWIVSMNELGSLFKPEFFAPLVVGIAAFLILFTKSDRKKTYGELFIGFGLLFIGLSFMSSSIAPYKNAPIFSTVFETLGKNPILGILAGTAVTALIQSSSASVGILQTLAMNGVLAWNSVVYITLGQNIGTCITALISSAGAKRNAKRAAVIHLLFNVIGAVIAGIIMYILFYFNTEWANSRITSVQISIFHTFFNVINTIILFPFAGKLVKMSEFIVRDKAEKNTEEDTENELLPHLDDRIMENPSFAVEQVEAEIVRMGNLATDQLRLSMDALLTISGKKAKKVLIIEETMDKTAHILTNYLVKVSGLSLTEKENQIVSNLFYAVNDIERIGDHCDNIAGMVLRMKDDDLEFSEKAIKELNQIYTKTIDAVIQANVAREFKDLKAVEITMQNEEVVDELEEMMRKGHIKRLSKHQCNAQSGIIFLAVITSLERIADHAVNLAGYVKEEIS